MGKAVGIFGGTFDPVHFGHLRVALELQEGLDLERVLMIPAAHPPHRDTPSVSGEHRLRMLEHALTGQSLLVADRRELDRPGPSRTVDTLRSLRAEVGDASPLCLLLGLDAFLDLATWYQWEDIPQLAHIVVAHRPGWAVDEASNNDALEPLRRNEVTTPQALHTRPAGLLYHHQVTSLAISATLIRASIYGGGSAAYLVPAEVWRYIQLHNLYFPRRQ